MNIKYNSFGHIEPCSVYLCRPNQGRICSLNGIDVTSFSYTENLQDFDTIEFTVNKYTDIDGELVESNGYEYLDYMMEILVDNIGRFIITSPPSTSNDGFSETKTISAASLEWYLMSKDLVDFKVNTGETTSVERLIDNNTDALGRTLEYITLYNPEKPELSLLHILLTYVKGWSIGYVDPLMAVKTPYFDISTTNIYAFMTQDISKYLQCIFKFDTINKQINVYGADNIGIDTNINISFRNLQKAVNIEPVTDDIYTRYTVRGNDELDFSQVNFGDDQIEDISYYLNTNYVSQSIIDKYNYYISYKETQRDAYVSTMKSYIEALEARDEIINRVPTDSLNYDWNGFTLEQLEEEKEFFTGLTECIAQDFTVDGILDMEALQASVYWWDYYSYVTWVIPNIDIAISNYQVVEDDKTDYLDTWETQWDLYGTNELQAKISLYSEIMEAMKSYKNDWDTLSSEEQAQYVSKDTYLLNHQNYLDAETNYNNAKDKYDELMAQVSLYNEELTSLDARLKSITDDVNITNSKFGFNNSELTVINNLYRDTDYTNEYFSTSTYTTNAEKLDIQLELLEYAKEDLAKNSRPQYSFTSDIDNLYSLSEFKSWHDKFELGNFIRVYTSDTHAEKLRLISKTYNPFVYNSTDLSIEFSNMLKWNNNRNDFTALFDDALGSSSKNSISKGSANGSDSTEISNELVKYILNSRQMNDVMDRVNAQNITANEAQLKSALVDYLKADELDANIGNFLELNSNTIFADYAKTDYVVSNFAKINDLAASNARISTLETDSLTANSAEILNLQAGIADIDTLIFGSASGTEISTEFANAVVAMLGDAQIRDAMIDTISADKINAGTINTNDVTIQSENGLLIISDNTIQISDGTNTRVQIGKDASNDYSINIWDADGNIMFSQGGITAEAIKSAIIRDDMVSDTANISAGKLNISSLFEVINNDISHTLNSTKIYLDDEEQTLDVAFKSMTTEVDDISKTVSTQGTQITAVQGQIANKIWEQDITAAVDELETDISLLSNQYSEVNQTVNSISATVSNHTTEIANKADKSQVSEVSDKVTQLTLDVDGFKSEVSSTYATQGSLQNSVDNLQKQIDGSIQTFTGTDAPTLENYPANEWTDTAALNQHIGDLYYVEAGGENEGYCYRFQINSTGEYEWVLLKDSEITKAVQDAAEALTTAQNVETRLTDYSTTEEVNSAIEQSASEIKQSVSETYTTKLEFENLEVGGRNLFLQTGFSGDITLVDNFDTDFSNHLAYYNVNSSVFEAFDETINQITFTLTSTSNIGIVFRRLASEIDLDPNSTYIMSAWVKVSVAGMKVARILSYRTTSDTWVWRGGTNLITINEADTWTKIQLEFKPDSNTYATSYGFTCNYGKNATMSIRNVKLEKGNKATDWTPAPEDVDTAITEAEESAVAAANANTAALLTSYSTTSEMNSAISVAKDSITSEVSKTYTTKTEFENLEVGGRNLIRGTKNFTIDSNSVSGWRNVGNWTFDADEEDFIVANKSQTGLTSNNIPSLYSSKFAVQTGDTLVFSCWFMVDDIDIWDGLRAPYIFEVYNSSNSRVQYQDVSITATNTNKPTVTSGKWVYFYSTHTVTATDAATAGMRVTLFRNGSLHVKKCKVEKGNKATDWTPAPEDVDSAIIEAEESAVTAANANTAALLTSYSTTEEMNSAIDQKADEIALTVSTVETAVKTYADTVANEAEESAVTAANANTAKSLQSYSTTTEMNSAINVAKNEITSTVAETYTTKTEFENNEPFITGTQTASTGSWTGTAPFSELTDGQRIVYWLPFAGSGNATLNLALSDGTTTGAVNCYYSGSTRLTTQYAAGNVIRLTYRKNVPVSGSSTLYTGWWADANYDSGNTYDRIRYQQAVKAVSAITAANIIVGTSDGYHNLKTGQAFDTQYPILYASSSISSGATGTNNYLVIPFTAASTQSITLTSYNSVYIKGTLNGSVFTPVSTTPLTQTIPVSEDGYYYILLGTAYSKTSMYLLAEHPIFTFINGAFQQAVSISSAAYTTASSAYTKATQTASEFSWLVADDYSESNVKLSSSAYDLAAQNITLSGNHIQLDGDTVITGEFSLNGNALIDGSVTASSLAANTITTDKLATDAIKSTDYSYTSGMFSTSGTFLDLNTGAIKSKNFAISEDGSAYFSGEVNATGGSITGNMTVTGTLSGGTISGTTISGGTISGTTISGATGSFSGTITANAGSKIGGWTITNNKIYGGDEDTGVAVMQVPTTGTTTVFGAGGTSHDNYSDCKFLVKKNGDTYINELYASGNLYSSGNFYSSGNLVLKTNGNLIGVTSSEGNTVPAFGMSSGDNIVVGNSSNKYDINIYGRNINLNNDTTVIGNLYVNGNARTYGIIPNSNGTYSLGDASGGFGWSNIYLGQASAGSSSPALRVITGSGSYFIAGLNYINDTSYLTFGNNTYITNIIGSTVTTSSIGESIRLIDGINFSANSGTSPYVYLACGADATSTYLRSYPVYTRTYSVAANMVVSATGFLGRYQSSSARYKHDIAYLSNKENATQKGVNMHNTYHEDMLSLLKLPVCKFKYNEGYMTGERDYDYDKYVTGFIAEDVASICPECATYQRETVYTTDNEGNEVPEYERDTDVVEAWDANKMIPRLLYIIQYQEKRISNLEKLNKEK